MSRTKEIFSKVYDENIAKIYRFIYLKVNSQDIAEDLCSETFIKAWQVFKSNKTIENPQAFLYQIARNLVIDHYRQKGRTQTVSPDSVEIIDPAVNLEQAAFVNMEMDNVKEALAGLRNDYQEIIIWHYVNEYSVPEISLMMDKSEGAVRVQLHRALRALKDKMNLIVESA
jgi:RNA polymerase sigma-70 factor (ECF subfamily)